MSELNITYVGVNALIFKGSKILLIRRSTSVWGGGSWCVPAGHAERNESLRQAMIRELHEELGIIVQPKDIEFVHVSHSNSSNREYVGFYFVVHEWAGEIVNNEPDKHNKLEWFDIHDLPETLLCKKTIQAYCFHKKLYSEIGWD